MHESQDESAALGDTRAADPSAPQRIATREAAVGDGLTVRRALPTRARRMVGAWCFLDHAGPHRYGPGNGLQVGPHPHIGLQTFTWMIAGEILHRDSLGYEQWIRPGQVNLMTAGRGITHAEESSANASGTLHAAQLWIALPDAERFRAPSFEHYPQLPVVTHGGFQITVLAGRAFGEISPARVYSPLVGLDFFASGTAAGEMELDPSFEHAALCLEGSLTLAGETVAPGTMLYFAPGRASIAAQCTGLCRWLLIGGEPFAKDILLWWNFVARTPEEMVQAAADWNLGTRFGKVSGTRLTPLVAPDVAQIRRPGS